MPWDANQTAKGLSALWGVSAEETAKLLQRNGEQLLKLMEL